jgi:ankyrin repeat protein
MARRAIDDRASTPPRRRWPIRVSLALLGVLLTAGAFVTAEPQYRQWRLGQDLLGAAYEGDLTRVRWLLNAGAPPNPQDCWNGDRTLTGAAARGYVAVVEALLDAGAPLDERERGLTPLMVTSLDGQTQVIELLLSRGADVNATVAPGRTPLMLAAKYGNPAAVRILLAHGANVNARPVDEGTALSLARRRAAAEIIGLPPGKVEELKRAARETVRVLQAAGAKE